MQGLAYFELLWSKVSSTLYEEFTFSVDDLRTDSDCQSKHSVENKK